MDGTLKMDRRDRIGLNELVSNSGSQTTGLRYNTKHREKYWVLGKTARSGGGSQSSGGTVARAWLLFFRVSSVPYVSRSSASPLLAGRLDMHTMCIFFRRGEGQKGRKKEEKEKNT